MISTTEDLTNLHLLSDHRAAGFSMSAQAHDRLDAELDSSSTRMNGALTSRAHCFPQSEERSEDYSLPSLSQPSSCADGITDPVSSARPSCSYSCLIAMALKASRTGALFVSEIYRFIEREYPFFRTAREGWKNSIRHALSLNTAFCKAANPHNVEAKKGFRWIVNPKYQIYLDAEIEKFLKIEGRKLIEKPDDTLLEEPSESPAMKKQKVAKSSTSKGRKAPSSKVPPSAVDISKLKQEIASTVIEKLSGLVTNGSNAAAQLSLPFAQHPYSVSNKETVAATNQLCLSQGLLQQRVAEQTKISQVEHASHLNGNVQTQQREHKCDSHESHNHYSSMPWCSVPSQTHAKLQEGTVLVPEKAGSGYANHQCPALYPQWLQQQLLRQPPVLFQGPIVEPAPLQQLDFLSTAMQPPPIAKLLESMQQMLPVQLLSSHLLQHQRPLVQLVAKRLQAMQQQALANYNHQESLHIKNSNSNLLLWPCTTQGSESEEESTAADKNVLNGFHPFRKDNRNGLSKIIGHVNGVCSSFKDISESGAHLELNEDEDPLPEMQDAEYRMCRSYSTSVESLQSLATTDVSERSAEWPKSYERKTDIVTHGSPKSNFACSHNASSSTKQAAIDNLSYKFSCEQIDDNDGVDEDELPLIGQKRKYLSPFSDCGHAKLQREDCALSKDEFSAAIAPFDITKHLINASSQVTEETVSMDTSDSSDSSTSTMIEACNANLTNVTKLAPPSTLANGTGTSWRDFEDNYPFRLLNFLRNHSASEEGTYSSNASFRDSDESLLSSISNGTTTSSGQCPSSSVTCVKPQYGSCMSAEEHWKSKCHDSGWLTYQSSLPGRIEYDSFLMCPPSQICTKGPRHSRKRH